VSDRSGGRFRTFPIARGVLESGGIVNLPRLKTHSLTRLTGALKNTFGCVVGARKAALHIAHPDGEGFGRMIADVNMLVPTRLVVMDAVRVMEGNGPAAGTLVDLGLLLVSTDPVAVDSVACRILGLDPLSLPHVRAAWQSGLGAAKEDEIETRGEPLGKWTGRRFAVPSLNFTRAVPPLFWRAARRLFIGKPVIDPALCVACGECVASCPTSPKSLAQAPGGIPGYDYGKCIRCYCCQETCPQGAISIRPAPWGRLLEGPTAMRKGAPAA
jgi:ferredoxin